MLCIPETAPLVERAVGLLDPGASIKALCFGGGEWCENVFDLLGDVDPTDCPEPYTTSDISEETAVIFWSSGTTGHPKVRKMTMRLK